MVSVYWEASFAERYDIYLTGDVEAWKNNHGEKACENVAGANGVVETELTNPGNNGTTGDNGTSGNNGTTGNTGNSGATGDTAVQPGTDTETVQPGITFKTKTLVFKTIRNTDSTIGAMVMKPVKKNSSSVTIPATVSYQGQKLKVTQIAKNAWKGNKKLKRVTIGKEVTVIGNGAFCGCKNLAQVTFKGKK